jgi:hypothetical protein
MADGALFKEQHRQTALGHAAANDAAPDPGANDDDVPMTGGGPGGQALSDGSSRRRRGPRHLYTPNLYQPTCLSAMFAILPLGPGSICQFERRASDTRNHFCPVRRPERSVRADHKGRNAKVRACPVRFFGPAHLRYRRTLARFSFSGKSFVGNHPSASDDPQGNGRPFSEAFRESPRRLTIGGPTATRRRGAASSSTWRQPNYTGHRPVTKSVKGPWMSAPDAPSSEMPAKAAMTARFPDFRPAAQGQTRQARDRLGGGRSK